MEDFLLIRKMKQGDEEAFETFVRKYYAPILQYCSYHCFDAADAEDLTQETFLKFFGSLQTYQHLGKTKQYLYTIAGNLCRNLAKKKQAVPMEPEILEQTAGRVDSMAAAEAKLDIEQALKALSPELREVLVLYYFQECKLTQIAEILQIGLPLVKYRLRRGKDVLKNMLEQDRTEQFSGKGGSI